MREHTINLYQYHELSEQAQEKARQWYIDSSPECFWWNEAWYALTEFCKEYGVTVTDYSVCPFNGGYVITNATNQNFRGLKLKAVDRDAMPTGYCLDLTLRYAFYDSFERTGDALQAFNDALDAWVLDLAQDWEAQYEEANVIESIEANAFEFLQDGSKY